MFGTDPQFALTCATLQAQISDLRHLMGRYLTPSLLLTHLIMHSSALIPECSPNLHQNTKFVRSTKAMMTAGLNQHQNLV